MKKRTFLVLLSVLVIYLSTSVSAQEYFLWKQEPNMLNTRTAFLTVSHDDNIYIIGGSVDGFNYPNYSNKMDIYNTDTQTWVQGTPMNVNRTNIVGCLWDDKIYAISGNKSGNNLETVEIYDINSGTWTYAASKPVPINGLTKAVVSEGKIYVMGGNVESYTPTNAMDVYDIATDTWQPTQYMPFYRSWHTVEVVGDKIYLLGGIDNTGASVQTVDIYNISDGAWTSSDVIIPIDVSGTGSCVIDNKIYLFGGASEFVQIYDTSKDVWILTGSQIPYNGLRMETAINNDRVYVLGGSIGSSLTNLMYSTRIEDKLFVLLASGEECQASLTYNVSDNYNYTWTSLDASIASVDAAGLISAHSEGETYILCTSSDGAYADYIPVKIRGDAGEIRLAVHLENVGDSENLWLSDTDPVTWSSMGSAIASVDSNGTVTANSRGLTVIEGTVNGKTHHIYVRVNA